MYSQVKRSPPYLIDRILPSCEISLLAGPTGAGKTRWLFDTLMDWEEGLPILGHQSHPVPWIYVAADRSLDAVYRTMDTMEIPRNRFRIVPAWDDHFTFTQIIGAVTDSKAKLAIVEGFGAFIEPPARSDQVRSFLCAACTTLKMHDVTVIGVVESPKMKPRDTYSNPRQRVSGAAAWGHHSETIFLVEPEDAARPADPRRLLTVCVRNGPAIVRHATFTSEGHLRLMRPNGTAASLFPADFA